jgi:hypothetical protein
MEQHSFELLYNIDGATEKVNKSQKLVSKHWVRQEPITCNLQQELNAIYNL